MALDTVHQPHSAIYTTMKFHIKASRRNRRHQQRRKGDEFSSVSSSVAMASTSDGSPSCAASSLLVDDRSSTDPSVQSPLRSCLRIHPIRKSSSPRMLRFQYVHVREFERIVGDNPSCSCGAPIGCVLFWAVLLLLVRRLMAANANAKVRENHFRSYSDPSLFRSMK